MKSAIAILHTEHRSLAAVLHGLRALSRNAQDPALRPNFAVFHAMIRYIDEFPERLHHPKEDAYLFERVLARAPEAAPLVEQLRAEHARGAQLIRELEGALLGLEASWPGAAQRFDALVEQYSRFHWEHMRVEEDLLLPLAERVLQDEDWQAISARFAMNEDPIAGASEKDFDALFTRIVNLAPPPVGLGERWGRRA